MKCDHLCWNIDSERCFDNPRGCYKSMFALNVTNILMIKCSNHLLCTIIWNPCTVSCKHTGLYWPLILHCVLQNLPPVRNQAKRKKKKKRDSDREKPEVRTRISSYDYRSWDKFDVVSINLKLSAVGFANIVLLAIECVCKSSFCFGFMNWNQVTLCQMTIISCLNPLTPKSD